MRRGLLACSVFALLLNVAVCKNVFSSIENTFETIYQQALQKNGVREITYDQFVKIINSKEKYLLFDARSSQTYNQGHINGAMSFPLETINKQSAEDKIKSGSKVIVYCASFECHASTQAAKKLTELGYKVVDYKGGIKEWQEKGNKLIK